jgi:hypothetical protein
MIQKYFCKNIDLDDMNQLTVGLLKKELALRKKELSTEQWEGVKPCLDISKWVLRADPTGCITILVPVQLI